MSMCLLASWVHIFVAKAHAPLLSQKIKAGLYCICFIFSSPNNDWIQMHSQTNSDNATNSALQVESATCFCFLLLQVTGNRRVHPTEHEKV